MPLPILSRELRTSKADLPERGRGGRSIMSTTVLSFLRRDNARGRRGRHVVPAFVVPDGANAVVVVVADGRVLSSMRAADDDASTW